MEEGLLNRYTYKGLYMNIDGLTESKFGELESILNRDERPELLSSFGYDRPWLGVSDGGKR